MDLDKDFSDVVSISKADALTLGVKTSDVLQLSATLGSASGFPKELLTCALQIVVRSNTQTVHDEPRGEGILPDVSISPLMYEIMCTASAMAGHTGAAFDGDDVLNSFVPITVSPMAVSNTLAILPEEFIDDDDKNIKWGARKIHMLQDLPEGSSISLSILYLDDEFQQYCEESGDFTDALQSTISFFLGGRILMEGTVVVIDTEEGLAIATVQQIRENFRESTVSKNAADILIGYRLGPFVDFKLSIDHEDYIASNFTQDLIQDHGQVAPGVDWQSECPGYDEIVHSLAQLASIRGPAAPSGILLTGSPQVGKTHLAFCVAHHLCRLSAAVHRVSVQDLLLQASWADEADLKKMLRPPTQLPPDQMQLLILDDLHVFENKESSLGEDSVTVNMDQEMLVVKNAVLQVIDELWESKRDYSNNVGAAVLGIAQSSNSLPPEFVKSGRLEKELAMLPPTESQREKILSFLIPAASAGQPGDEAVFQRWARALAPVTVGCVAGDLRRILSDAWTRALARREEEDSGLSQPLSWDDLQKAAQTYIPLQLETVDVSKPKYFFTAMEDGNPKFSTDMELWAEAHRLSWNSFGGFPLVKKRLLRTVVVPWKFFLKSLDQNSATSATSIGLSPPPGVLFHGESGTGKSLAAVCLASSLGLPMIKVKAADVMDKWLGGSEAIIRGLFARARSAAPCILFFDELDSVATNRASGDEGGAELMARLLSTLLNEMDGISNDKRRQSVLVVACTNRLEDLDSALLRPGRLEEHIELKHPDPSDIRDILRVHLSRVPVSPHVNLDSLAQYLAEQNASGAEVEGLCHTACLRAAHRAGTCDVALMQENIDTAIHALAS
jgi:ATP-dependent 26S proteasome regulatory subunit